MAGRPDKYDELVKPRLEEIKDWIRQGVANVDIAKALGVHKATLCRYANEHRELYDALHYVPRPGVQLVRDALLKKATGYRYTETKTISEKDPKSGLMEVVSVITTEKEVPPDSSAAGMYLRNYDDEFQDHDKFTRGIRTREIELKEKTAESQNW